MKKSTTIGKLFNRQASSEGLHNGNGNYGTANTATTMRYMRAGGKLLKRFLPVLLLVAAFLVTFAVAMTYKESGLLENLGIDTGADTSELNVAEAATKEMTNYTAPTKFTIDDTLLAAGSNPFAYTGTAVNSRSLSWTVTEVGSVTNAQAKPGWWKNSQQDNSTLYGDRDMHLFARQETNATIYGFLASNTTGGYYNKMDRALISGAWTFQINSPQLRRMIDMGKLTISYTISIAAPNSGYGQSYNMTAFTSENFSESTLTPLLRDNAQASASYNGHSPVNTKTITPSAGAYWFLVNAGTGIAARDEGNQDIDPGRELTINNLVLTFTYNETATPTIAAKTGAITSNAWVTGKTGNEQKFAYTLDSFGTNGIISRVDYAGSNGSLDVTNTATDGLSWTTANPTTIGQTSQVTTTQMTFTNTYNYWYIRQWSLNGRKSVMKVDLYQLKIDPWAPIITQLTGAAFNKSGIGAVPTLSNPTNIPISNATAGTATASNTLTTEQTLAGNNFLTYTDHGITINASLTNGGLTTAGGPYASTAGASNMSLVFRIREGNTYVLGTDTTWVDAGGSSISINPQPSGGGQATVNGTAVNLSTAGTAGGITELVIEIRTRNYAGATAVSGTENENFFRGYSLSQMVMVRVKFDTTTPLAPRINSVTKTGEAGNYYYLPGSPYTQKWINWDSVTVVLRAPKDNTPAGAGNSYTGAGVRFEYSTEDGSNPTWSLFSDSGSGNYIQQAGLIEMTFTVSGPAAGVIAETFRFRVVNQFGIGSTAPIPSTGNTIGSNGNFTAPVYPQAVSLAFDTLAPKILGSGLTIGATTYPTPIPTVAVGTHNYAYKFALSSLPWTANTLGFALQVAEASSSAISSPEETDNYGNVFAGAIAFSGFRDTANGNAFSLSRRRVGGSWEPYTGTDDNYNINRHGTKTLKGDGYFRLFDINYPINDINAYGEYEWLITVYDVAGNQTTIELLTRYDNQKPVFLAANLPTVQTAIGGNALGSTWYNDYLQFSFTVAVVNAANRPYSSTPKLYFYSAQRESANQTTYDVAPDFKDWAVNGGASKYLEVKDDSGLGISNFSSVTTNGVTVITFRYKPLSGQYGLAFIVRSQAYDNSDTTGTQSRLNTVGGLQNGDAAFRFAAWFDTEKPIVSAMKDNNLWLGNEAGAAYPDTDEYRYYTDGTYASVRISGNGGGSVGATDYAFKMSSLAQWRLKVYYNTGTLAAPVWVQYSFPAGVDGVLLGSFSVGSFDFTFLDIGTQMLVQEIFNGRQVKFSVTATDMAGNESDALERITYINALTYNYYQVTANGDRFMGAAGTWSNVAITSTVTTQSGGWNAWSNLKFILRVSSSDASVRNLVNVQYQVGFNSPGNDWLTIGNIGSGKFGVDGVNYIDIEFDLTNLSLPLYSFSGPSSAQAAYARQFFANNEKFFIRLQTQYGFPGAYKPAAAASNYVIIGLQLDQSNPTVDITKTKIHYEDHPLVKPIDSVQGALFTPDTLVNHYGAENIWWNTSARFTIVLTDNNAAVQSGIRNISLWYLYGSSSKTFTNIAVGNHTNNDFNDLAGDSYNATAYSSSITADGYLEYTFTVPLNAIVELVGQLKIFIRISDMSGNVSLLPYAIGQQNIDNGNDVSSTADSYEFNYIKVNYDNTAFTMSVTPKINDSTNGNGVILNPYLGQSSGLTYSDLVNNWLLNGPISFEISSNVAIGQAGLYQLQVGTHVVSSGNVVPLGGWSWANTGATLSNGKIDQFNYLAVALNAPNPLKRGLFRFRIITNSGTIIELQYNPGNGTVAQAWLVNYDPMREVSLYLRSAYQLTSSAGVTYSVLSGDIINFVTINGAEAVNGVINVKPGTTISYIVDLNSIPAGYYFAGFTRYSTGTLQNPLVNLTVGGYNAGAAGFGGAGSGNHFAYFLDSGEGMTYAATTLALSGSTVVLTHVVTSERAATEVGEYPGWVALFNPLPAYTYPSAVEVEEFAGRIWTLESIGGDSADPATGNVNPAGDQVWIKSLRTLFAGANAQATQTTLFGYTVTFYDANYQAIDPYNSNGTGVPSLTPTQQSALDLAKGTYYYQIDVYAAFATSDSAHSWVRVSRNIGSFNNLQNTAAQIILKITDYKMNANNFTMTIKYGEYMPEYIFVAAGDYTRTSANVATGIDTIGDWGAYDKALRGSGYVLWAPTATGYVEADAFSEKGSLPSYYKFFDSLVGSKVPYRVAPQAPTAYNQYNLYLGGVFKIAAGSIFTPNNWNNNKSYSNINMSSGGYTTQVDILYRPWANEYPTTGSGLSDEANITGNPFTHKGASNINQRLASDSDGEVWKSLKLTIIVEKSEAVMAGSANTVEASTKFASGERYEANGIFYYGQLLGADLFKASYQEGYYLDNNGQSTTNNNGYYFYNRNAVWNPDSYFTIPTNYTTDYIIDGSLVWQSTVYGAYSSTERLPASASAYDLKYYFNPENSGYETYASTVPLAVSKATLTQVGAINLIDTATLTYGNRLRTLTVSNSLTNLITGAGGYYLIVNPHDETGENNVRISGSFGWAEDIGATIPAANLPKATAANGGFYQARATFTPVGTNFADFEATVSVKMAKAKINVTVSHKSAYDTAIAGSVNTSFAGGAAFYYGMTWDSFIVNWQNFFDYFAANENVINDTAGAHQLSGGTLFTGGDWYDAGLATGTWSWDDTVSRWNLPNVLPGTTNNGVHVVSIRFTPTDTLNYESFSFAYSTGTQTIGTFRVLVLKASPTIAPALRNDSTVSGVTNSTSIYYGQRNSALKGSLSAKNNAINNTGNIITSTAPNGILTYNTDNNNNNNGWVWTQPIGGTLTVAAHAQLITDILAKNVSFFDANGVSAYYTKAQLEALLGISLFRDAVDAFGVKMNFGTTDGIYSNYVTVDCADNMYVLVRYEMQKTTPIIVVDGEGKWNNTAATAADISAGQSLSHSLITWSAQALNPFSSSAGVAGTVSWASSSTVPESTWVMQSTTVAVSGSRPYVVVFTPTDTANYTTTDRASLSAAENYVSTGNLQINLTVNRALVLAESTVASSTPAVTLGYGSLLNAVNIPFIAYWIVPIKVPSDVTQQMVDAGDVYRSSGTTYEPYTGLVASIDTNGNTKYFYIRRVDNLRVTVGALSWAVVARNDGSDFDVNTTRPTPGDVDYRVQFTVVSDIHRYDPSINAIISKIRIEKARLDVLAVLASAISYGQKFGASSINTLILRNPNWAGDNNFPTTAYSFTWDTAWSAGTIINGNTALTATPNVGLYDIALMITFSGAAAELYYNITGDGAPAGDLKTVDELMVPVRVNKSAPDVKPAYFDSWSRLRLEWSQKLSDALLSSFNGVNNTALAANIYDTALAAVGNYSWVNVNESTSYTSLASNRMTFTVRFTPSGIYANNYEAVTVQIIVAVDKATVQVAQKDLLPIVIIYGASLLSPTFAAVVNETNYATESRSVAYYINVINPHLGTGGVPVATSDFTASFVAGNLLNPGALNVTDTYDYGMSTGKTTAVAVQFTTSSDQFYQVNNSSETSSEGNTTGATVVRFKILPGTPTVVGTVPGKGDRQPGYADKIAIASVGNAVYASTIASSYISYIYGAWTDGASITGSYTFDNVDRMTANGAAKALSSTVQSSFSGEHAGYYPITWAPDSPNYTEVKLFVYVGMADSNLFSFEIDAIHIPYGMTLDASGNILNRTGGNTYGIVPKNVASGFDNVVGNGRFEWVAVGTNDGSGFAAGNILSTFNNASSAGTSVTYLVYWMPGGGNNNIDRQKFAVTITIDKATPGIWGGVNFLDKVTATTPVFTYGQTLSAILPSVSSNSLINKEVYLSFEAASLSVAGTWAWVDGTYRPDANETVTAQQWLKFVPSNTNYETVEFKIDVQVMRATIVAAYTATEIYYGNPLTESTITPTFAYTAGGTNPNNSSLHTVLVTYGWLNTVSVFDANYNDGSFIGGQTALFKVKVSPTNDLIPGSTRRFSDNYKDTEIEVEVRILRANIEIRFTGAALASDDLHYGMTLAYALNNSALQFGTYNIYNVNIRAGGAPALSDKGDLTFSDGMGLSYVPVGTGTTMRERIFVKWTPGNATDSNNYNVYDGGATENSASTWNGVEITIHKTAPIIANVTLKNSKDQLFDFLYFGQQLKDAGIFADVSNPYNDSIAFKNIPGAFKWANENSRLNALDVAGAANNSDYRIAYFDAAGSLSRYYGGEFVFNSTQTSGAYTPNDNVASVTIRNMKLPEIHNANRFVFSVTNNAITQVYGKSLNNIDFVSGSGITAYNYYWRQEDGGPVVAPATINGYQFTGTSVPEVLAGEQYYEFRFIPSDSANYAQATANSGLTSEERVFRLRITPASAVLFARDSAGTNDANRRSVLDLTVIGVPVYYYGVPLTYLTESLNDVNRGEMRWTVDSATGTAGGRYATTVDGRFEFVTPLDESLPAGARSVAVRFVPGDKNNYNTVTQTTLTDGGSLVAIISNITVERSYLMVEDVRVGENNRGYIEYGELLSAAALGYDRSGYRIFNAATYQYYKDSPNLSSKALGAETVTSVLWNPGNYQPLAGEKVFPYRLLLSTGALGNYRLSGENYVGGGLIEGGVYLEGTAYYVNYNYSFTDVSFSAVTATPLTKNISVRQATVTFGKDISVVKTRQFQTGDPNPGVYTYGNRVSVLDIVEGNPRNTKAPDVGADFTSEGTPIYNTTPIAGRNLEANGIRDGFSWMNAEDILPWSGDGTEAYFQWEPDTTVAANYRILTQQKIKVTVAKAKPTIAMQYVSSTPITYGDTLFGSNLNPIPDALVTTRSRAATNPNALEADRAAFFVDGHFEWTDPAFRPHVKASNSGTRYGVRFAPSNENYESVTGLDSTVTVLKREIVIRPFTEADLDPNNIGIGSVYIAQGAELTSFYLTDAVINPQTGAIINLNEVLRKLYFSNLASGDIDRLNDEFNFIGMTWSAKLITSGASGTAGSDYTTNAQAGAQYLLSMGGITSDDYDITQTSFYSVVLIVRPRGAVSVDSQGAGGGNTIQFAIDSATAMSMNGAYKVGYYNENGELVVLNAAYADGALLFTDAGNYDYFLLESGDLISDLHDYSTLLIVLGVILVLGGVAGVFFIFLKDKKKKALALESAGNTESSEVYLDESDETLTIAAVAETGTVEVLADAAQATGATYDGAFTAVATDANLYEVSFNANAAAADEEETEYAAPDAPDGTDEE
ncbi:MAG: hypothetical protein LBT55_01590 [Clostridiaceae bacterium]|jgi:hypothetical protein|nr:hypothetical protein [Clostridiaceae bacterium]